MKYKFIVFILLCLSLNAEEQVTNIKENIQKELNDEVKDFPFLNSSETQNENDLKEYNDFIKSSNDDIEKFKKVTLMDVILETVATSPVIKASRERVVQNEIKLKDAVSVYYPTINFEYEASRSRATETNKDEESRFKYFNDRNYKFILNQNLYAGGETSNNIKNLEKKLEGAKNQYYLDLSTQVASAVKAYFDVVFAYKTLKANEKNMQKLNKILEIVTVKYNNGAASIGDLTAIKANVSNSETTLYKVKSDLTKSLRYFEYIVGNKFSQTLPYEKNFNIDITTLDLLFDRALVQNKDLINYYKSIEAEKFALMANRSSFDPKVDFELSLDNIMDKEGFTEREETLNGMIKLTYNLYNGGRDQSKILTSYSAIRKLNYELEETKKKLRWNISELHTSINSSKESLKSNISEVISLRKMVDAYWEEFNLGEQDLPTLLQGQRQLNSAETELIKYEKNSLIDYFNLLKLTGDLLAFFDIDPESSKFINFANGNYMQDLYADDKFLNEKEKIEKKELELKKAKEHQSLVKKAKQDINMDSFRNKLLTSSDNFYSIKIEPFKNISESTTFVKTNNFDETAFAFDKVNNQSIDSLVIYGLYDKEKVAEQAIEELRNKISNVTFTLVKVKDVKNLYEQYKAGLVIEPTPPEIKIVEKVETIEKIKQLKEEKIVLNEDFKNSFLEANPKSYTIHISSFGNKKEIIESLSKAEEFRTGSFVYKYMENKILYRWVFGVFEKYEDALVALNNLGRLRETYYPVINTIENELLLYNGNLNLNTQVNPQELEYEYINETIKTEYKNPIDIKDIDLNKDKELTQKVKDLLPKDENITNDLNEENNSSEEILQEDDSQIKVNNSMNEIFKNKFLSAPRDFYTINLATITNENKIEEFLNKNNLVENSFGFKIGEDENIIRIVYGIYQTKEEALTGLENLPNKLLKEGKPYVDKIYKNQDLYKLYKEKLDTEKIQSTLDSSFINQEKFANPVSKEVPLDDQLKEAEFKEKTIQSYTEKEFDKYNNLEFKEKFLSASGDYYTLNLVTLKDVEQIERFISRNPQINKETIFTYTLGMKLDKVIVLNGLYKTKEEAQMAMKELSDEFVSRNKPFIERISKKQEIYFKHHGK